MTYEECKHNDYVEVTCSEVVKYHVFRSKVIKEGTNPIVTAPVKFYGVMKGEQLSLSNTYWVRDIKKLNQLDYFLDNIFEWYED